jgi:hypothetical protein
MDISSVIFCEDIRPELDGKFSAMGIFTDLDVLDASGGPAKLPFNIRLGFLIRILRIETDGIPDNYSMKLLCDGDILTELSSTINNFQGRYLNIMGVNPFFVIPKYGSISLNLILRKGNEEVLNKTLPDVLLIKSGKK